MIIKQLMRKFGYISEKDLVDIAVELYEKEDTINATDENDFYYRAGNANALGCLLSRFGIDLSKIIRERKSGL